jgi:hypothetical protein
MVQRETPVANTEHNIKARLREELHKYLIVSAYLYICFVALQLFKTSLLREAGMHYVPLGIAAAKALILGKFLLIGESAGVGSRVSWPTLLHRIAYRVILFFVLLIALSFAEEFLVGLFHGHTFIQTLGELRQRPLPEMLSSSFLILLILVPLVAFDEINRALGPGVLWRLLTARSGQIR